MQSTGDLLISPDVEACPSHRSLQYAASSISESDTEEVLGGNKANQENENIVNREYKSLNYDKTNTDNLKSPGQIMMKQDVQMR